jgi:acetyl-CoA carboxylase biotin carboxyl carrier protein
MAENEPHGELFDVEQIARLMELMERHAISVVDVRTEDGRLRLRRGFRPAAAAMAPVVQASPMMASAPASPPPLPSTASPAPQTAAAEDGPHIAYVKSPMVGTFYLRPKPDAEPYVKVGDRVDADTNVCIIEAMKTFNEIPAGVSGLIVAILAKNEEPVDYDRPLFKVDTSR